MIRLALFIIPFMLLADVYGQQPDFAIVGQDGEAIEEITVISGVSLQLRTNFTEIRGTDVAFPDNHRTSSDEPYEIGFPFVFYETAYTQYFIGANGYITFDNPPRNPAPLLTEIPFATSDPQYPRNSIFGAFKGWEATSGIHVTRLTIGDAPNRKLILTWCEIPAMQSESYGTFQIILYESGEIEIHLIEIPFSNYAGNETAVGIQSSNPFQGLSAPQRNYGPWPPISQESWRFRWVNSDYEVESIDYEPFAVAENIYWYELEGATGRNLISDQQQVSVTPKISTRYQAEISSCWGVVIATAELSVIVEGVFPTAFNPRSIEVANRTFKMPVIPDAVVANYLLQVYNRWGQLVFETNDINTGWNGRMQNTGQECPAGVYHWIILVEENGKTPVTNSGAVMLLR
jgi:hypothetical protein